MPLLILELCLFFLPRLVPRGYPDQLFAALVDETRHSHRPKGPEQGNRRQRYSHVSSSACKISHPSVKAWMWMRRILRRISCIWALEECEP
jgi:hypothetical protein